MFPMFVKGKRVMVLSYKPTLGDIIKNDATGDWYKVESIEGRKVQSYGISAPTGF
ncbi:hypothetical protein [Brevibacillus fortis]|uniref:hypothetical protein n=1 Tax=Brevibacillus fortis TaxID=2126352 RepID=UPI0038FC916F